MRQRTAIAGASAVAAAVLLFKAGAPPAWSEETQKSAAEASVRPVPRIVPQRQWEYSTLVSCAASQEEGRSFEDGLEASFNEQGKHGWELISLISPSDLSLVPNVRGRRGEEPRGGRWCWLATFKREQVH
jgi:hypothetical protein